MRKRLIIFSLVIWIFYIGHALAFEFVTSVSPLKKLVKELFPEYSVKVILPPGRDFHTYEPTLYQWQEIKKADVVVIVGTEPWAERVFNIREHKPVFSLLGSNEVVKDPHLWFDLDRIKKLAISLVNFMTNRFKDKKREFAQRLKTFLKEINEIKKEYQELGKCKVKKFFLLGHPVFDYLLRGTGVKEVTLVKGYHREETPGMRSFYHMLEEIKKLRINLVFISDPEFLRYKDFFENKGIKVETLWSGAGFPEKGGFVKLLKENLEKIKKALNCK